MLLRSRPIVRLISCPANVAQWRSPTPLNTTVTFSTASKIVRTMFIPFLSSTLLLVIHISYINFAIRFVVRGFSKSTQSVFCALCFVRKYLCLNGRPEFKLMPYKILNHWGFIRIAHSILCGPHKRELARS